MTLKEVPAYLKNKYGLKYAASTIRRWISKGVDVSGETVCLRHRRMTRKIMVHKADLEAFLKAYE